MLAEELHIGSAIALEDSTVGLISQEYLYGKLLKNPDFTLKLLHKISRELGFSQHANRYANPKTYPWSSG